MNETRHIFFILKYAAYQALTGLKLKMNNLKP